MTKFRSGIETTTLKITSGSPGSGKVLTSDASGDSTWVTPAGGGGTKTFWVPHNFVVGGEIKVPVGQVSAIPPMFVSVLSGTTAKLVRVRYSLGSGTSCTFKIQHNGSDATGFTGLSATTTATSTTPTAIVLADEDRLEMVATAVSGTPFNLTVGLTLEYEV